MKVSVDWLKDHVDFRRHVTDVADKLTMAGLEVKGVEGLDDLDDEVMELEITSNRPDWLSHVGVAREISAVLGRNLKFPIYKNNVSRMIDKGVHVIIEDHDLCPYYSACLLEDVEFGESPQYIQDRLKAVGLRPVNLVVDVTNYVLYELGQPLHAFDFDKLAGKKIIVRRAGKNEKITAINGDEYELSSDDLVIADEERPVAIAGVMGGMESEVGNQTKNILLESAFFKPSAVRATSLKLGLSSESSYRFERRVDPKCVDIARERVIYLLRKHGNVGRVRMVAKEGRAPVKEISVRFDLKEIERIIGVELKSNQVKSILSSLGARIISGGVGSVYVKVPSFRADLTRPIDLVEEIVRIWGYDKVPETLPGITPVYTEINKKRKAKKILAGLASNFGFNEIITYTLINEKPLELIGLDVSKNTKIINPLNKELTMMRPSFIPSFMEVIKRNENLGNENVKVFEIGRVYGRETKETLPREEEHLGLALSGRTIHNWLDKGRPYNIFDLKGFMEAALGRLGVKNYSFKPASSKFLKTSCSLEVFAGSRSIGLLGEVAEALLEHYGIEFPVYTAEINLEELSNEIDFTRKYREISKFPSAKRDMAVVVKESVKAEDAVSLIKEYSQGNVKKVDLFDCYKGKNIPKGHKSLAFTLIYQAEDRTLVSEEIEKTQKQILERLKEKLGASLR